MEWEFVVKDGAPSVSDEQRKRLFSERDFVPLDDLWKHEKSREADLLRRLAFYNPRRWAHVAAHVAASLPPELEPPPQAKPSAHAVAMCHHQLPQQAPRVLIESTEHLGRRVRTF